MDKPLKLRVTFAGTQSLNSVFSDILHRTQYREPTSFQSAVRIKHDKKLCYRRRTARRDVSVKILPTAVCVEGMRVTTVLFLMVTNPKVLLATLITITPIDLKMYHFR